MFGALFGCLEPVLTVTSFLSHRSPFVIPFDQRDKQRADEAKRRFAGGQPSDHKALLTAYVGTFPRGQNGRPDVKQFESWVGFCIFCCLCFFDRRSMCDGVTGMTRG